MSTAPGPGIREPEQLRGLLRDGRVSTEELVQQLLINLSEDPARGGLARTPERVARSLAELTRGRQQTVADVVGHGVFEEDCSEMVIVKDIEFYSLCEHHLLPFFGKAHVAYIPMAASSA